MKHDIFNPATYELRDLLTGEILDVAIFIEEAKQDGWEKAYVSMVAQYIGFGGNATCKVLVYLIEKKDGMNRVVNTNKGISIDTGVSIKTVSSTMTALQKSDFVRKVSNGVYMLTPKMIRYGSQTKGAMLLSLWERTPSTKK